MSDSRVAARSVVVGGPAEVVSALVGVSLTVEAPGLPARPPIDRTTTAATRPTARPVSISTRPRRRRFLCGECVPMLTPSAEEAGQRMTKARNLIQWSLPSLTGDPSSPDRRVSRLPPSPPGTR